MIEKMIRENLKVILKRIERACIKSNRDPKEVRLLLATKTVGVEKIKIALEGGQTLIGENKVQEIKEKYEGLSSVFHEKHFIGHLQTNKIKDIIRYEVNCIQSVDRLNLALKLDQRLSRESKEMDVFIQVNTSNEDSKFGVQPEEALDLVRQVAGFKTLNIRGLMTIGLFSAEESRVRKCFKTLKALQREIIAQNIPRVDVSELSMGMSGDLEVAIEEGATIVRVGTAIFGEREYPDSYYWNERKNIR